MDFKNIKKKEGLSSRTMSHPIADPHQVLAEIPIGNKILIIKKLAVVFFKEILFLIYVKNKIYSMF